MSLNPPHLYLASQSPRRRELLQQIGVGFSSLLLRNAPGRPQDVDETPHPGEDPVAYVQRVCRDKARHGVLALQQRGLPPHPVLAADTTVTLDGAILGKPADRDEAIAMLRRLSGREHQVLTAVALAQDERCELRLSVTAVSFVELDAARIRRYVQSGESQDKAGAYGIQGRAAAFVKRIEGSYSGVVGLPLCETAELLQCFGISIP
jgi:septum formation protein